MKSWIRAVALLKKGEGIFQHMYLDTEGNVTIGVGEKVPSVQAAKELPLVNRKTGKAATAEEIEADFKAVNGKPEGMTARQYRPYTALDLPLDKIDSKLDQRIKEFEIVLFKMFERKWDLFPEDAQLGLLDMVYTLGRQGLEAKFPKFMEAVKNEDWKTAAAECRRPQVSLPRNQETRMLFEAAAKQKAWEEAQKQTVAAVQGAKVTK